MLVGPWGSVYDIMAHFTRIGVGMEYWAMGEIWSILQKKKKVKVVVFDSGSPSSPLSVLRSVQWADGSKKGTRQKKGH